MKCTSVKQFCYQYPILVACIVPFLYTIVLRQCIMGIAMSLFITYTGFEHNSFGPLALGEGVTILVSFVVLFYCGNIQILTQRGIPLRKSILYSAYMLFEIGILFLINIHQIIYYSEKPEPGATIIGCISYLFLASMAEELIYRGFLVEILISKYQNVKGGLGIVLGVSSFAFASIHLSNILILGVEVKGVLLQMINAFFIGTYFALVYSYTKCIWISISLHFLYNFSQIFRKTCFTGIKVDEVISDYGEAFNYQIFLVHSFIYITVIVVMVYYMKYKKYS